VARMSAANSFDSSQQSAPGSSDDFIVAVDGPAGAGKGTVAKRLATAYGLAHLESGLLYRAAGLLSLRRGIPFDQDGRVAQLCETITLDDLAYPELRSDQAAQAASCISVHPSVRAALLDLQRRFAHFPPDGCRGTIIDGRDIGTVVCPEAPLKFFVDARVDVRAKRRHQEFVGKEMGMPFEEVLEDMKQRDKRDRERAEAPLVAAHDAVVVDTSDMTIDQAVDAVATHVDAFLRRRAEKMGSAQSAESVGVDPVREGGS